MSDDIPRAWRELVQALNLLAKGHNDDESPLYCEHDQLTVAADPGKFTATELEQLEGMGFHADHASESFYSYRFGS